MHLIFPHHDEHFFIGKRIGIFISILLAASTGFLVPSPKQQVLAYQSSFASASFSNPVQQTLVVVPKKRLMVISAEIGQKVVPTPTPTLVWGKARQVDEHTWTLSVADDSSMASARDIADALNVYRQQKGVRQLSWDQKLAEYAQSRADHFNNTHNLDSHAGFQDFINNQDGFNKVGFYALGENSSIGYTLTGTHLIEWVYAADKPHDDNQLSSEWTHVGVGVSGNATNLIFGGRKQ